MRLRPGPAALLLAIVLSSALSCDRLPGRAPRKSQPATVTQTIGRTKVTVTYNRPSARGRALFGSLVPFGQPWDPGADEATTIAVSRDVRFGGRPLPEGRYSVWVVPQPAEWTFILSTAADVPHTPYPEGRDALRLQLRPTRGPYMEALGFYFPVADSTHALLALHWGETIVEVPISTR